MPTVSQASKLWSSTYLTASLKTFCFRCFEVLSSTSNKHFNFHIKRAYCLTSQRRASAPGQILSAVNTNIRNRRQELHRTRLTMRSAVSENRACSSTTGLLLVSHSFEATVHYIQKDFQVEHVSECAVEVTANVPALLVTDTAWTFVQLLKGVARRHCSLHLQDIRLELGRSRYVLKCLGPENKHQNRNGHCITEPSAYPRRLQHNFGSVQFGARKTLKNIFVLLSAVS